MDLMLKAEKSMCKDALVSKATKSPIVVTNTVKTDVVIVVVVVGRWENKSKCLKLGFPRPRRSLL